MVQQNTSTTITLTATIKLYSTRRTTTTTLRAATSFSSEGHNAEVKYAPLYSSYRANWDRILCKTATKFDH